MGAKMLVFAMILLMAAACGGGGDPTTLATGTTGMEESDSGDGGDDLIATDITNAIFTARSADCADYMGAYESRVVDVLNSQGFDGTTTVEVLADTCTLASNNIPNHDMQDNGQMFATAIEERNRTFTIVRNPQLAGATTPLSQQWWDGIFLNGTVIDLLSAGCWDGTRNVAAGCSDQVEWLIDPIGSNGFFTHDSHNAHTQPDGTYHYHGNPNAMFDGSPGPEGSPIIGFASDGFPIYGSYFLDPDSGQVRKAISGYTLKDGSRPDGTAGPGGVFDGFYVQDWEWTDSGDLDACNGMTVNGQYGYYITNTYPWIVKCLRGTPHGSFQKQ